MPLTRHLILVQSFYWWVLRERGRGRGKLGGFSGSSFKFKVGQSICLNKAWSMWPLVMTSRTFTSHSSSNIATNSNVQVLEFISELWLRIVYKLNNHGLSYSEVQINNNWLVRSLHFVVKDRRRRTYMEITVHTNTQHILPKFKLLTIITFFFSIDCPNVNCHLPTRPWISDISKIPPMPQ